MMPLNVALSLLCMENEQGLEAKKNTVTIAKIAEIKALPRQRVLDRFLSLLSPREEYVIKLLLGEGVIRQRDINQIAELLDTTSYQINITINKAIDELRHFTRTLNCGQCGGIESVNFNMLKRCFVCLSCGKDYGQLEIFIKRK